jgi:hypothetical protein
VPRARRLTGEVVEPQGRGVDYRLDRRNDRIDTVAEHMAEQ